MKNDLMLRNLGGRCKFNIRYCLINNIDTNYREPLEVHTDGHGKYILVPDPPVDAPEKLLHREFIGYFGIQGLYDETQKKITLARSMLSPSQSGSKYYLTESNNILEPIGLTAVYGLKSPIYYYFSLPAMEEEGVYYADYLGHSGYSYTDGREPYLSARLCQLSYDADKGAVCAVPDDLLSWVRMYYESASAVSPTYDNAGTDVLPLYHVDPYIYAGSLRLIYNASESGGTHTQGNLYIYDIDSAILNTFSALDLTSMRLQITVSTDDTSHGSIKLICVTGIEVNGTLYYVDVHQNSLHIPEGATQVMLCNTNTEYPVYEDADIFPFE